MLEEALSFYDKINVDSTKVTSILSYKYDNIDSMSDIELSKCCIVLAQYLIYFRWQSNKVRKEQLVLKNKMESVLFHTLSEDIIKRYKTKTDAKAYLVNNVPELLELNERVNEMEYELILSDGLEKPIQEMINVLKREQTRRESELALSKIERR